MHRQTPHNGWVRVGVKVPTVNKAWYHKGNRRYLTKAHTQFKADVAVWLQMTEGPILPEYNGSLEIHYRFGVSNANTDIDNLIKPAQDAICEFLKINDNRFKGLTAYKKIVAKGEEAFEFQIVPFNIDKWI